ncbi:MAG: hypothetical protein EKE20_14800 [Candidatus Symbiopectobacterium sp. Dall1.0]|nr:hypothetical protein [Candidatus Symbiopectobacterium sp. Dall1.0]
MSKRPTINRIWSINNSTSRRNPGNNKYGQGWVAEIPTYQVLNYLQYKTDLTLLSLGERGFFEWGSDINYAKGALVWNEADNTIYISLVASPDKNKSPDKNAKEWSKSSIQISRKEFDDAVTKINSHVTMLGHTNPHKLTPKDIDTYSRVEVDSKVKGLADDGAAHIADKNNPHGDTAEKIGAVPKTGGTYTGQIVMGTGKVFLSDSGKESIGLLNGGNYILNASCMLGIDKNGKAVHVDATGKSSILVDESNYLNAKLQHESSFAVGCPDFYSPLISDLNIYEGAGNCEFKRPSERIVDGKKYAENIPVYSYGSAHGINLIINDAKNYELNDSIFYDKNPLVGIKQYTVNFNINFNSPKEDLGNILLMSFGLAYAEGSLCVEINNNRKITASLNKLVKVVSPDLSKYDGKSVSVSIRRSIGDVLHIYVSGISSGSSNCVNNRGIRKPVDTGNNTFFINANSTSFSKKSFGVSLSSLRVWREALTDEQISTL